MVGRLKIKRAIIGSGPNICVSLTQPSQDVLISTIINIFIDLGCE